MVVVAMASGLSGCWWQAGGGPENARFNGLENTMTAANVGLLAPKWTDASTGATSSEPIISGRNVYTTETRFSAPGVVDLLEVKARRVATGDVLWNRTLLGSGPGAARATPVSLIKDALWVASASSGVPACASTLSRIDPGTGTVLSAEQVEEITSPVVGNGSIVATVGHLACDPTFTLVVRDVVTRAVLWSWTFSAGQDVSAPVIAGGRVYVVAGTELYAFVAPGCGAATCLPLWITDGAADGARPVAGPGDQVLIVHDDAAVRALAGATGDLLWETAPGDPTEPTAIEGIAVGGGYVYVPFVHDPGIPGTTTSELAIYAGLGCGVVVCGPLWTTPLGLGQAGPPAVGGGVAYVSLRSTPRGSAIVATSATGCPANPCSELHRLVNDDNSRTFGPPSLASGRLVFPSEHELYAFGL